MKHIFKSFKSKKEENTQEAEIAELPEDTDGEMRLEKFYSYFIYSNIGNEIIGDIKLTEEQANKLNEINRRDGTYRQDIAFLRK